MKKRFDSTDIINVDSLRRDMVMRRQVTPTITLLVNEMMGKVIQIRPAEEISIGRSIENEIALDLVALSRKHCVVFRQGKHVYVRDLESTNGTFVNGERIKLRQLKDGDRVFLGDICVCKFAFTDQIDLDINRMLFEKATRDVLTGLYNRTYFQENFRKEFLFHRRADLPMTLAFFDLDDFKQINDQYGHTCGDLVLKDVAFAVRQSLREIDFFARFGGEEMVILFKNTDHGNARDKCEQLRKKIETHQFQYGEASLHVTASFGVATLSGEDYSTPQELLIEADTRMYKAKQNGKNQVVGNEVEEPEIPED